MSRLIDELEADHKIIADTLGKVKTLGISSEEGQKTLLAAKAGLLAHLAKEDRDLYPVLRKAAETDPSLQSTLDFYAKDMDEISSAALEFFAKYATGGEGLDFAKDFGRLVANLTQRIRKEETTLYKKYNELVD